jgi:predicted pyridoxine 5'-phosphate oxidase superfamily flavin-nucleotide-binding protein
MAPERATYHPGEIEVQRRAGVREEADDVGRIIGASIPPALGPLLAGFRLAVAASIDARGRVWASLLSGPPGFLRVVDETRLDIEARPADGDPLWTNLVARPELGLIIFDPATRRR